MKILKLIFPFLLLILISFFVYKPILHPGFFPMHDDTQVVRVSEMGIALKDGMFPVRWAKDLGYGYGYPIFNFYNPLPYYAGGFISVFLNDALLATKILFFLAIAISAISAFLLGKELFGKLGGLITSVFYVYAPYHAVDIYVRGALSEAFAYAYIPLLFYGAYKIYKKQNFWNLLIFSLALAFVICSHNLTALIVLPFVLVFLAYLYVNSNKKNELLKFFLGSLGLGLMLSAFYFIPAILEMNYTNVISQVGGGADFKDHFVCISQLWSSPWGYGGSVKGCTDGLSFMIGKYHIILFIITAFTSLLLVFKKFKILKIEKQQINIVLLFSLFFVISTLMTLSITKPVWELFKPFAFVQYPWRFLALSSLFSSFLAGSIYIFAKPFLNKKTEIILTAAIIIFIIFVSIKFFVPQKYLNVTKADYLNGYSLKWTTSRISDEYMPKNFQKPKSFYDIPNPNNLVSDSISASFVKTKTQDIELNINVVKQGNFIFPIAYFPSWKAYVDSKETKITPSTRGMIVNLPTGKHFLKFKFIQTPIELASSLVSFAGILIVLAGIILLRFKKYNYG